MSKPKENQEPSKFKIEGKMSKQQINSYILGLKSYLLHHGASLDEKQKIEAEIDRFTNIKMIADKITFNIVEK